MPEKHQLSITQTENDISRERERERAVFRWIASGISQPYDLHSLIPLMLVSDWELHPRLFFQCPVWICLLVHFLTYQLGHVCRNGLDLFTCNATVTKVFIEYIKMTLFWCKKINILVTHQWTEVLNFCTKTEFLFFAPKRRRFGAFGKYFDDCSIVLKINSI